MPLPGNTAAMTTEKALVEEALKFLRMSIDEARAAGSKESARPHKKFHPEHKLGVLAGWAAKASLALADAERFPAMIPYAESCVRNLRISLEEAR
jgi:hypothetical protein